MRFLAVRKCGGCGEILDFEHFDNALCDVCGLRWRVAKTESCPSCNQSAVECPCMPKGLSRSGALCLRKLFFYSAEKHSEPQNRIIYYIKKKRSRRISAFLAKELSELLKAELEALEVGDDSAVIVNVPRGRRAVACHGFDQSELICRELSSITTIPHVSAIQRKKGGKEQKKLDRSRRFRNVEALFEIVDATAVSGKYVILFDDIVTTGASMAACCKILRKSGAKGIICLCIAQD